MRPEAEYLAGEDLRAKGFLAKALGHYRRALSGLDKGEDPEAFLDASLSCAGVLRSLGLTREARSRLLEAASIHPGGRDLRLELALVDRAEGKLDKALREMRSLLAGADRREAAYLWWAMAGAYRLQGRLAESSKAFKRSLGLARGDAEAAGYALLGLAGVERIRGKAAASEGLYREAGEAFSGGEDRFAQAYALCGRANALRQLGRWDEAERLYGRARKLYSALGDGPDLAFVLWGLARIRMQRGDLRPAVGLLREARALFLKGGETRGRLLADFSEAQALYALGRAAEARTLFDQALRLARRAGLNAHLETFT
jgi:tetratricopeptide (TPR) repeat protein